MLEQILDHKPRNFAQWHFTQSNLQQSMDKFWARESQGFNKNMFKWERTFYLDWTSRLLLTFLHTCSYEWSFVQLGEKGVVDNHFLHMSLKIVYNYLSSVTHGWFLSIISVIINFCYGCRHFDQSSEMTFERRYMFRVLRIDFARMKFDWFIYR